MKKVQKRLLYTGGTLVLIAFVMAVYMFNKPHRNYAKANPDIVLTAFELQKQFAENEVEANAKFLNKVLQVAGVVAGVDNTSADQQSISFIDQMFGVTATFSSDINAQQSELIRQIKPGDKLVIKGRCDGYLTDVRLSQCYIVLK